MSHKIKKIFKITAMVLCLPIFFWFVMIVVDYWRTIYDFERPIFAKCTSGFDDGGSGTYTGIGYSIELKGNFMLEDELSGVTHVRFMVFGKEVKVVVRD